MRFPVFNVIDIVAVVLLVMGAIQGRRRGLSEELERVFAVGFSLLLALRYYTAFGALILRNGRLSAQQANAVSFILLAVGLFVVSIPIRLLLKSCMLVSFKQGLEDVGGCILGFLKTFIVLACLIAVLSAWSHDDVHRLLAEQSFFGRMANRSVPVVYGRVAHRYPRLTARWDAVVQTNEQQQAVSASRSARYQKP